MIPMLVICLVWWGYLVHKGNGSSYDGNIRDKTNPPRHKKTGDPMSRSDACALDGRLPFGCCIVLPLMGLGLWLFFVELSSCDEPLKNKRSEFISRSQGRSLRKKAGKLFEKFNTDCVGPEFPAEALGVWVALGVSMALCLYMWQKQRDDDDDEKTDATGDEEAEAKTVKGAVKDAVKEEVEEKKEEMKDKAKDEMKSIVVGDKVKGATGGGIGDRIKGATSAAWSLAA